MRDRRIAGRDAQPRPSAELLADAYQKLLLRAAQWLGRHDQNNMPAASPAMRTAADWLLSHPQLSGCSPDAETAAMAQEFLDQRRDLLSQVKTHSRTAPAMWDGAGEDDRILIRGNPRTPGEFAARGLPLALMEKREPISQGSGRLQLAEDVLDPANPLTARVMANRIWGLLMGRGIVASPDNFGVLGQPPSHPELLDYLALRLRDDWSLKRLIREVVLSRTYQQSTHAQPAAQQIDPANLLWHHYPLKRLPAESIRDALLLLSGRWDSAMYGPSVPVHLTAFMQGRGRPGSGPIDGLGRRSVYTSVRRNFLSPMMLAFDFPQPTSTIGRRTISNVPAQALILLNDPLVLQQCRLWAERMLRETPEANLRQRVDWLYHAAFARDATEQEHQASAAFLLPRLAEPASPQVWSEFCHVLVNLKEFIYLR